MYAVLLILALNPQFESPLLDRVDRVELNHFYGPEGNLVFSQVIWYDWSLKSDRFEVVAWRLLKDVRRLDPEKSKQWERDNPDGPPYVPEWIGGHAAPRRINNGRYVSEWVDEKCGQLRRVEATTFLETWTSFDRELDARQLSPERERRELKPRRSNAVTSK